MTSSPPMSMSPTRAGITLKPSKSDTNLAVNTFAIHPPAGAYLPHPEDGGGGAGGAMAAAPPSPTTAAAIAAAAGAAGHGHHAPLIPSYPYNLSMSSPFIPGCSSSDPRLFEQHAPDDSSVQTRLPSIAVDYLSHDWKEDDVWASWKAMTKHKSELANGVRLENASWRTWAKQRGKLKTISPETLNWLKDSDVTWLYGPLHTAVDPVPPPKESTTAERLGLSGTKARKADKASARSYSTSSSSSISGHHGVPLNVKPILKHRSLSDILSVPNSGAASPSGEGTYSGSEDEGMGDLPHVASSAGSTSSAEGLSHHRENSPPGAARRPGILRTSSADSSSHPRKTNVHPHGFDSEAHDSASSVDDSSYPPAPYDLPSSATRGSFRRTSSQDHFHAKKRHIVFNHRVEQCISLDVEDDRAQGASGGRGGKQPYSNALQRYGNQQESSSSSSSASSSDDDDDDEDDDEDAVLTFRSSSPKSPSFMKPFLPSPTATGPPSLASGQGSGKKIPYGTHGPHGVQPDEPHTIAPLEPTTLKDSELMPGPTPIVVYQDGKITAFYGTEEDYVYDAEEHGGIPHWVPKSSADLGGTAIADDDDDSHAEVADAKARSPAAQNENDAHYTPTPASSERTKISAPGDATAANAQAMMQNDPVSSSARFVNSENGMIAGADGHIIEPQMETAYKTGYFGGPESAIQDDYDNRLLTSSQAKYGNSSVPHGAQQMPSSQPLSTSSSNSSSDAALSSAAGNMGLYSTSPSGALKGPTKSILKKGRDPSQPGSADYYPPVPPAVTRASRAHAQMFDENGDEVVSPQRAPIRLPETATLAQDGSTSPSLVLDSGSNQALSSSQYSGSLGLYNTAASSPLAGQQQEPSRGRSISRGNSSSSLYERAQSAAAAAEYRSRSQSGGSSISPVASYSPPFTASLNSLGAGTAVMYSQPAESSRGRTVQTARPSTRREALSDTSSDADDDDDSSDTEGADDEGQAANMDFSEDTQADGQANTDSVHFARHHGAANSHASMKQSHNATLNDNDDAEVEQVSSPEANTAGTDSLNQSDFESRPANAANAGRGKASLSSSHSNRGRQGNAAMPISGSKVQEPRLSRSYVEEDHSDSLRVNSSSSGVKRGGTGSRGNKEDGELELDSDTADHLFDSPYMPSSPKIASFANLVGLQTKSGSGKDQNDPYTLSWADKDDPRSRTKAEGSLLQSLASSQSRPSWLSKRRNSNRLSISGHPANHSEDELSDPANNGYSYGYGFDEDEEDQKGYVGKATDLIGALWNVGSSMVWGRSTSNTSSTASTSKSGLTRRPSS